MSNQPEEEYLGTPLLEGATTLLLIGGNELGCEILVEAHRLGLETVVVSDHQQAPASHLSHRKYVLSFDDEQALRAILKREQPDLIIQDSPAVASEALTSAVDDLQPKILPQPEIVNLLENEGKVLEQARQSKAGVIPFAVASTPEEVRETSVKLGLPCFIREMNLNSEPRLVRSNADLDRLYEEMKDSRTQSHALLKKFVPYDLQAIIYAVMTNFGSRSESLCLAPPIGTLGNSSSLHVAWQPLWTIDDQTRMSSAPFSGYGASLQRKEEGTNKDYLWESELNGRYISAEATRDVEAKLNDYSTKIIRRLQEEIAKPLTGVIRLDYLVRLRSKESGNRPEIYLNDISPHINQTALLTLATQQPTITSCLVRTALGITVPRVEATASGVSHIIQARQNSGWAPAFFNLSSACNQAGTSIQLFAKHRFSASESVGMAFAIDQDILKAREKALTCAHKVEEGIDYGS